ncbi:MAG: hypothetical protein JXR58_08670 [Bacteroidales bacterium]|nr:hypothetical protein [Bacteroidales bacterium]
MKKTILTFVVALTFIGSTVFVSCSQDKGKEGEKEKKETPKDSVETEVPQGPVAGITPFDFPTVSTSAKAGEFALTPSMAFIERAWKAKEEGKTSSFIFYSSTVVEPGDVESKIKQIGAEVNIPNSLVIPIPANQTAKKGDIVLTWWQSGSGMQRAIVVNDSEPTHPVVKYLDIDYDNPAKNKDGVPIGQMEEKLEANSFMLLSGEWMPGTAVAYNKGSFEHWQVISVSGDKVLACGWAGVMAVLEKSKCTPIPVKLDVKAGDLIQVPQYGTYKEGKVKKVDASAGRVWVEVQFGGEATEIVVSQGDIIKSLL